MAKYHAIDTDLWEELLDYPPRQKLLYIYLFSNALCRPSGLYKIHVKTIQTYTQANEDDIKALDGSLIVYDRETSEVWVRGKMKRILSGLENNPRMTQAIVSDFDALRSTRIRGEFLKKYGSEIDGLKRSKR